MTPGRRQHRIELGDGVRPEHRQSATFLDQPIGGQHAGAAAIGDDGQPIAALRRHARQRGRGVKQLLEFVNAQHAGAAERGVVDDIGAGQRTRVLARPGGAPERASTG